MQQVSRSIHGVIFGFKLLAGGCSSSSEDMQTCSAACRAGCCRRTPRPHKWRFGCTTSTRLRCTKAFRTPLRPPLESGAGRQKHCAHRLLLFSPPPAPSQKSPDPPPPLPKKHNVTMAPPSVATRMSSSAVARKAARLPTCSSSSSCSVSS